VALNPKTTHYDQPPTSESRDIHFQRDHYKAVAPEPSYWPRIYEKLSDIRWQGFTQEELASIAAPMLIVAGDYDFVRVEHAVDASKAIPNAELAIIPSASHFVLYSEPDRVIPIVKHFLDKPERGIPLATAQTGYHPGETR
jgi:pimeloyl-ACP methyl ester carboxylesterase